VDLGVVVDEGEKLWYRRLAGVISTGVLPVLRRSETVFTSLQVNMVSCRPVVRTESGNGSVIGPPTRAEDRACFHDLLTGLRDYLLCILEPVWHRTSASAVEPRLAGVISGF